MKYLRKSNPLPYLVLGASGIGLLLRIALYATAVDSSNLLIANHPLHILTLLLTVCVVAFTINSVRKLDGSNNYKENFHPSIIGAVGSFTAAAGALLAFFEISNNINDRMDQVWAILGLLSAPCLIFTGICRLRGKRPSFLFHGMVCLFLATNMVCEYRLWSGSPQLPDYLFHLFACVFLTLTGYYRMAFDVGLGRRRMQLFCNLMATYFSFLSLVGEENDLFFLFFGIWAFSNLCNLYPPARRQRPEASGEEAEHDPS